MQITLKEYDRTITILSGNDGMNIDDVIDELIKPALIAVGFSERLVDEKLDGKVYEESAKITDEGTY